MQGVDLEAAASLGEALTWLDALVARGRGGARDVPPLTDSIRHRIDAAVPAAAPSTRPPDLEGLPAPAPPAAWHWSQLRELMGAGDPPERVGLHACWLGFLLSGEDPERAPRVTVLTPVYNRAGLLVECVTSALDQNHPQVEVVVVDDGSEDHPERALAPFAGRIQLVTQANAGVAAARNCGLALATGEYVQFLDSDDLLDPDALASWLAALQAVADADLCYSRPRWLDPGGVRKLRTGDPSGRERDAPTVDLLRAVTRRTQLVPCGLLVPRWRLIEVGGFDPRLRRAEDARLFFQLALAGAKLVRIEQPKSTRRVSADALTSDREAVYAAKAPLLLLNLTDLLRTPRAWQLVRPVARKLFEPRRLPLLDETDGATLAEARAALLDAVDALAGGHRHDGLSAEPVLRGVLEVVGDAVPASSFARQLVSRAEEALGSMPALDERDVAFWLAPERPRGGGAEVHAVLGAVDVSTRTGHPLVPLRRLSELTRARPGHRWARRWGVVTLVARVLGERAARSVSRAIDFARRIRPDTHR